MAADGFSPQVPPPAGTPDGRVTTRAFDAEIRRAIHVERVLVLKALASLAVAAAALAAHVLFFT